jgi:uncharacterized protein (TIGR02266 family)
MVQDTRKDPRAKVLTMTVRYKSATIDEFIEHHSHDVSRGGIFIKTPSPFPPGTLLKFEIRISEDKPVLGGVGRVVWKRDPPQATNERPAGMGVKFLKIDDASRGVIDRIITVKGDAPSEFESGGGDGSAPEAAPAAAPAAGVPGTPSQPATVRAIPSRKPTMLGLGAVPGGTSEPPPKPASTPPAGDKFFPETKSAEEMPPPEERTVMRQAAELLAEALKGAGGSMEEIGAAPGAPKAEAKAEDKPKESPKPEAKPEVKAEAKPEAKPEAKAEEKAAEPDKAKDDDKAKEADKP